tara:strand:- start:1039 stop:1554 length:516 start_codon:yes stop_codon:yes gene_type:complete
MKNESFWIKIIYIVSAVISAAVAFLVLGPRPDGMEEMIDVSILPFVNAVLNSITIMLLLSAFIAIKNKRLSIHKKLNLSAFATSSMFLISYVIYHWFKAGPKEYQGDLQLLYYFILISHIILAIIILPMALFTLYRGWQNQIQQHRKIAKITLPIWMYVSITGVLIYVMLY